MRTALQKKLFDIEMTQEELSEKIGRSKTYVSFRMTGRREWDLGDVYNICGVLQIKPEEIPLYFPPPGSFGKKQK